MFFGQLKRRDDTCLAPLSSNCRAVAKPIPLDAPTTSATALSIEEEDTSDNGDGPDNDDDNRGGCTETPQLRWREEDDDTEEVEDGNEVETEDVEEATGAVSKALMLKLSNCDSSASANT